MQKGQPLQLKDLLPYGVSPEDFYTFASALAAFLCVMAVGNALFTRDTSGKRVKALNERRAMLKEQLGSTKRRRRNPESSVNLMRRTVERFKLLKKSGVRQVEDMMIEAGWRSKDALVVFAFFGLVTPIAFGILGLVLMQLKVFGDTTQMKMLLNYSMPVALAYLGLKLPVLVVRRKRKKRYLHIQRALADTLDLMTICAEAGLSLAASLNRVSRELGVAYPEMAEELGMTSVELGFLPDRNQALMNLTERVKLPEIRGIVSVLIQTEKYGTPIAQAMRVLSAEFREQRMLRAENKAAQLPAIMTVPMILFILPTLFIIVLSPAIIRVTGVTGD